MTETGTNDWSLPIQERMLGSLKGSSLTPFMDILRPIIGSGKMLRSRIAQRLAPTAGISESQALDCAAAVELFHAATLLHDDVIDGAEIRRRAPSFWTQKGMSGAILVGDLLVCKALKLLASGCPDRMGECIDLLTEVCDGEIRQELVMRDRITDCDACLQIASKKTGSLFALLALTCAGSDANLAEALKQSGMAAGTAYQVADDVIDHYGTSSEAGKSVNLDSAAGKYTLAYWAEQGKVNPIDYIADLLDQSLAHLQPWPETMQAWQLYLDEDLKPVIDKCMTDYLKSTKKSDTFATTLSN